MVVVVGVRDAPVAWLYGIWQKAAMVALQGNKSWFGLAGGGATVRLRCVLAEFVRVMEPGGGSGAWELGKPSQKRRFGSQGNEEKYTRASTVPPAVAAAAKRPPPSVGAGNLPLRLAAMLLLPHVAMTTAPGPCEATSMRSIRRNSRWNHIRNVRDVSAKYPCFSI
uniref:Uncharacterized protein n=1 Tax=Oryza barthii TaxID=65489 RepID=A0A0D3HUE3_9ORYZ